MVSSVNSTIGNYATHLEVLTNSPQCKNANIANFVLAVSLEMNKNKFVILFSYWYLISPLVSSYVANKEENLQISENTNLAIMPIVPILCVCENPDKIYTSFCR